MGFGTRGCILSGMSALIRRCLSDIRPLLPKRKCQSCSCKCQNTEHVQPGHTDLHNVMLNNESHSVPLSSQASWTHQVSCTALSSNPQSLHQYPHHHLHRPSSLLAEPLAVPWQHAPCDQQHRSARTACCPNQTRHMTHPAHTLRVRLRAGCTLPDLTVIVQPCV